MIGSEEASFYRREPFQTEPSQVQQVANKLVEEFYEYQKKHEGSRYIEGHADVFQLIFEYLEAITLITTTSHVCSQWRTMSRRELTLRFEPQLQSDSVHNWFALYIIVIYNNTIKVKICGYAY